MEKDAYVYCTRCKDGKELIESIEKDIDIPNRCKGCFPYNIEDSYRFCERPNYTKNEGEK